MENQKERRVDKRTKFNLKPRCHSILESVRDQNLLPSLNAAINFLISDYSRLQSENARLKEQVRGQSGVKVAPKVDAASA